MNKLSPLILATTVACAREGELATVELALEGVPERVSTISISVRDLESGELATSATIAAPKTSVSLGVPAERELEFTAIARTDRIGPPGIGAMPAYLGRAERTIALGREQELVAMTVHRAGVLTIFPALSVDPEGVLGFRVESEDRGDPPVELAFDPEDPRQSFDARRSLILRSGRYRVVLIEDPEESPFARAFAPSRGIYVAPETETLVEPAIEEKRDPPPPGVAAALAIAIDPARVSDGAVLTSPGQATRIRVAIAARDLSGAEVSVPRADLIVTLDRALTLSGGLPVEFEADVEGTRRMVLRAIALLPEGRTIRGELAFNVLEAGVEPGPAESLELDVEDPAGLARGTRLSISLLDARGLFASSQAGSLDLSASDPWAYFPAGPTREVTAGDRGRVLRELARPSAPRGDEVIVRATFTSTPAIALTSSIALPLLEIR